MSTRARPLTAALVVVALLMAAGPAVATVAPRSTLTPSEVPGIVTAYSTANNKANLYLSVTDQNKDEGGSAGTIDDSYFTFALRAGFKNSEGTGHYYPFNIVEMTDAVPHGLSGAGSFLSLNTFSYPPGTPAADRWPSGHVPQQLAVISRTSATAPWLVTFEPIMSKGFGTLATSGGYATTPNTTLLDFPINKVAEDLAGALQRYSTTDVLAAGLTSADLTYNVTIHPWSLPNLYKLNQESRTVDLNASDTVTPYSNNDLHAFALTNGDTLVTFSIKIVTKYTSTFANGLVKIVNTKGKPSTWEVPAGAYRWVKIPTVCEVVAVDPPTSVHTTNAVPNLVGAYCGDVTGATVLK